MDISIALKQLVRETVLEIISESGTFVEPDMITIERVAEMFDCDHSVIRALIANSDRNGFPAVKLGSRTILIDKTRLIAWMNAGGLLQYGEHHENRRPQIQGSHLKAVDKAA